MAVSFRRAACTATTAVLAAGALTIVEPALLGLAGTRPWLYAAAFPVPRVLGLAAVTVLLGAVALRARGAAPAAGALALATAVSGAVVLHRGAGAGELPAAEAGDVTVVTVNTEFSRADVQAVASLVLRTQADVVTMPETTARFAGEVAAAVRTGGGPALQVLAHEGRGPENTSTSLLVSDRWGPYRKLPARELPMRLGAVAAVPVAGDGPPLAAVHPYPPVGEGLPTWEAEGLAAVRWCETHPGALVGGDFNATPDHPALRALGECVDVSVATGTGSRGTWPSRVPALLGAPIDHVLADARRWRPVASAVVDVPGTDHRAVVARVRPS
ncbi:endonuclease/exonuclease/phosphatase family protein [Kineococcus xinjiangensis]|uniref:endonuclease/exonuclease/phosphatase family protein n=1 Tax=Kineococcus xinjiangensis TaxID=512762 RepID=UPI000CEC24F8|nr:endonuclease/exonuclease/phosphatase family protein [Kineococcus xinjiangensis]